MWRHAISRQQRSWPLARCAAVMAWQSPAMREPRKPSSHSPDRVTWYGQIPIMVAIEKGFFKEQGIEIDYKIILNSTDRIAALTAGSVALLQPRPHRRHRADGAEQRELLLTLPMWTTSRATKDAWARPGIGCFKDLKGKKVAANTSAEISLHGQLRANGMTIADVQYRQPAAQRDGGRPRQGRCRRGLRVEAAARRRVKTAAPDGKLLGSDADTELTRNSAPWPVRPTS